MAAEVDSEVDMEEEVVVVEEVCDAASLCRRLQRLNFGYWILG